MSADYNIIEYTDELLADQTVCRRYSDGRTEWRTLSADRRVVWRDNFNQTGVDELLGGGIVKRIVDNQPQPIYGREQGYGRTLWSNNRLTVNRTSFPGKVGKALMALRGALLLGGLVAPPVMLAPEQEAELRRQQQQQTGNSSSSSSGDSDWDSGSDSGDEEFG